MPTQWQSGYPTAQSWTGRDWMTVRSTLGVDPYLVWAETSRFLYLGGIPQQWVSVILELSTSVPAFATKVAGQPWIQLHPRYTNPPAGLSSTTFCTALVTKPFFENLHTGIAALSDVKRFELGLPIVHDFDIEPGTFPAPAPIAHVPDTTATCVVGIIDDGFAFAHERFRKANGSSRIDFLWDQSYFSPVVTQVDYGREFTNANIDDYVTRATVNGCINEDTVYRLAAYREVRRRIAHATLVADVACGADADQLAEHSPHMVCVQLQLPSRKTRDRSGGWLAVRVLDGVRYIIDRGDKAAPGKPVAVNLSFGNIAGPHDGSSIIERALDELVVKRPPDKLAVVFAAGNSNLSRCHAEFELAPQESQLLTWRVLPDDPTPNFMEIWLPRTSANEEVRIEVTTPAGDQSPLMGPGQVFVWGPPGEAALCTVVYRDRIATGDGRMVLLAVAPTASADRTRRVAVSGEWKVVVTNPMSVDLPVSAWIQRDETPFNFPRHGRQSRYEDENYLRFEPPPLQQQGPGRAQGLVKATDAGTASTIRRDGTINSLATGANALVVGGYRRSDGAAVPYSSSGPAVLKMAPDAAAVSDDSVVCHGVIAAGARTGSAIAMDGTSVSAAAVTRWVVGSMAGGQPGGPGPVQAKAAADELLHPAHYVPRPPPNRVGAGRLITPPVIRVPRWKAVR